MGDFHLHSQMSDGRLSIPQIIDLYGTNGFGTIAITDHLCEEKHWLGHTARWLGKTLTSATFSNYQETLKAEAERAWKLYKMVVIPGYEITKNSTDPNLAAHFLILGVDQWISPDLPTHEILRQAKDFGGFTVAAHPVATQQFEPQTYYLWNNRADLDQEKLIDAWEVASGPFLFEEVQRSGLSLIANSDMHHPRQLNSWKTRLHCEKHPEAIFEALRRQQLDIVFFKKRRPVFEPLRTSAWQWL